MLCQRFYHHLPIHVYSVYLYEILGNVSTYVQEMHALTKFRHSSFDKNIEGNLANLTIYSQGPRLERNLSFSPNSLDWSESPL